jgi:hypothetical protein
MKPTLAQFFSLPRTLVHGQDVIKPDGTTVKVSEFRHIKYLEAVCVST